MKPVMPVLSALLFSVSVNAAQTQLTPIRGEPFHQILRATVVELEKSNWECKWDLSGSQVGWARGMSDQKAIIYNVNGTQYALIDQGKSQPNIVLKASNGWTEWTIEITTAADSNQVIKVDMERVEVTQSRVYSGPIYEPKFEPPASRELTYSATCLPVAKETPAQK